MKEWVSVKDFGAVGDFDPVLGTGTDNLAAFQAALDAAITSRKALYVPGGAYRITGGLSVIDAPLTIFGDGINNTVIVLTANHDLLTYTATTAHNQVPSEPFHGGRVVCLSIANITFATTVQAGAAIRATFTSVATNYPKVILDDVQFKGIVDTSAAFMYGLAGHNASGTRLSGVRFEGDLANAAATATAAYPFHASAAISLTGDEINSSIFHVWNNLILYGANAAVRVRNYAEGFYINNFEFVAVGDGVDFVGTLSRSVYVTELTNGHVDFYSRGISADRVWEFNMSNISITTRAVTYAQTGIGITNSNFVNLSLINVGGNRYAETSNTMHGIVFDLVNNFSVTNSNVYRCRGTGCLISNGVLGTVANSSVVECVNGIILENNTHGTVVTGNRLSGSTERPMSAGISCAGATHDNTLFGNIAENVAYTVGNSGLRNRIYDNVGPQTTYAEIANGDSSPDVGRIDAQLFVVNNSAPTTITTFDNSYVGQDICLLAVGTKTTIANAAAGEAVPIYTGTGSNLALPNAGSVTLKRFPSFFVVVSKNF